MLMKLIFTILALMTGGAAQLMAESVQGSSSVPASQGASSAVSKTMMPRAQDFTLMWWADGFPGVVQGAPWLRCIRTGHYAFHLNTETLKVEHLAAVTGNPVYRIYQAEADLDGQEYAPADLRLKATVNGKEFLCRKGGKWSRWDGPRVIAAGRFMQRADVTKLEFVAADGEVLEAEARFETVAWADRLSLVLALKPKKPWQDLGLVVEISNQRGTLGSREVFKVAPGEQASAWQQVALVFDPVTMQKEMGKPRVLVRASERSTQKQREVVFDSALDCHRIDIDKVVPVLPAMGDFSQNDAIEQIRVQLQNPSDSEQLTRLLFEKTKSGFSQSIGSSITGISATLRDKEGNPTGIPVQLSKNWHNKPEGGVYTNAWFHGVTQLRLPPQSDLELELTVSYGHWGGVPAASHAQLSLIGWGSNQLWEQSAIGAWGESLCYEPSQVQADCTITDVRPLMVSEPGEKNHWKWTNNVGGGDFFRLFDKEGKRMPHKAMQAVRHKLGPCLTEVTYGGKIYPGLCHSSTVSLGRSDDIVRGTFRLIMNVYEPIEFSRFVIFQAGADTYNYTAEKKLAIGNETGMIREWDAEWGGDTYRTEPVECVGRIPWVSMCQAEKRGHILPGTWANRGLIVRSWKARLGGKEAAPWVAERGTNLRDMEFSTMDFVPPPGVTRLEPGDYVEATIEYVVHPQAAEEYYGPNRQLKSALQKLANSWKMVYREAVSRHIIKADVQQGQVAQYSPDVVVQTLNGNADLTLTGGMGYTPVTFMGLPSHDQAKLLVNGKPLDQSVHGNDFWQTDYDSATQSWSRTYNIPTRIHPNNNTTHIQLIHP